MLTACRDGPQYMELYDHTHDNGTDFDTETVANLAYASSLHTQTAHAMLAQAKFFFHDLDPPSPGPPSPSPPPPPGPNPAACAKAGGIGNDPVDLKVCCAKSCGSCGGKGCAARPGGKSACCTKEVQANGVVCAVGNAPCTIK